MIIYGCIKTANCQCKYASTNSFHTVDKCLPLIAQRNLHIVHNIEFTCNFLTVSQSFPTCSLFIFLFFSTLNVSPKWELYVRCRYSIWLLLLLLLTTVSHMSHTHRDTHRSRSLSVACTYHLVCKFFCLFRRCCCQILPQNILSFPACYFVLTFVTRSNTVLFGLFNCPRLVFVLTR